jgi:hypothetical protein
MAHRSSRKDHKVKALICRNSIVANYVNPAIQFHKDEKKREQLLLARTNEAALAPLEETIEKHIDAFWEVARALREIKEQKLWVGKYDSWESYLKLKWNWGMRYGNQIVAAAKVKEIVPEVQNEAQARPLVRLLSPEGQALLDKNKAWCESPEGKAVFQKMDEDYRAKQAAKAALEHPTQMSPDDVRYGMSDEKKLAIMISGKSPQKACAQLFGQIRGLLNTYMGNIKPAEQDRFRGLVCKELNSIIEEYNRVPAVCPQLGN